MEPKPLHDEKHMIKVMDEPLPLKPTSTIIFTIARMNPPTPGHLNVVKELIQKAIETNDKIETMEEDTSTIKTKVTDVYIILSKTMDNDENPIPCNEKIDILGRSNDVMDSMIHSLKEEMMTEALESEKDKINNINVVCICVESSTPFSQLGNLIYNSYGNVNVDLYLIVGDDRKDMIDNIESVFKKYPNVLSIGGKLLTRENMEMYKQLNEDQLIKINISEIPRDAFSASFVRKLVKYGLSNQFKNVYLPYLKNEAKINELYNSILNGFEHNNPSKKTANNKRKANVSTKKSVPLKNVHEDQKETTPKRVTKRGGNRKRIGKTHKKKTCKKSLKHKKRLGKTLKNKNIKN